ncbi:metal ABC transporter solute-binding protein, Zn/Mn family [Thiolapillus sp.]
MNTRYLRIPALLALLFSLLHMPAYSADDQLRVVASIKPVHAILSGLLKGLQEPELIVGKGRLPYGHQLSDAQKQSIDRADLVVWVGPELEKFMAQHLGDEAQSARVITLLDRPEIKVLPSRWDDGSRDPFFWSDSRNAIILLDLLAKELMVRDPGRSHLYKRNRDAMFEKIAELDRRLEYGYRGLQGGVMLSYYDTLQYFEQAYALKVGGVLTSAPGVPVSAEKLLKERAWLADGVYACLLTEANMQMPELSLLISGIEIEQVELDSFGSKLTPGENLYIELMENNTRLIKQCLQKKGAVQAAPEEAPEAVGVRKIGGKFLLRDHKGNIVTEKDLLGHYSMLYFGYTFCPDVCPTGLSVISTALKRLGPKAEKIKSYFITVDPERDTQEVMANYVGYFHEDMVGLMGSRAMTDRIIKDFNLIVEKVQEEGADPNDYIIDHTASVFLFAPDGTFITKFAHGISPSQMVDKLNEYVK